MSESAPHPRSLNDLPRAKIEKNWKSYLIWLAPIGAAALAGWFLYSNLFRGGPTLHIFFENAAELEPGKSQLKYRGAEIGEVKHIRLTEDQKQVEVTVSVEKSAEGIAREGSRFWIVKPEVSVEEIRGLQTIVSGDYIAVAPGTGQRETKFNGLPGAPVLEAKGALKVKLIAEKLGSLKERSPVFYRGVQVGQVVGLDLAHDSQNIEIVVQIQPQYVPLVRMNSKFWNAGGIHANLSLSGLNIAAQSAETLLSGGIAFATPNSTDKMAAPGTSFRLYDKPDDAWLGWAPTIELGSTNNPSQKKPSQ